MNSQDLYRAIGEVEDELLERSEAVRLKKRTSYLKWGAVAACLCVVLAGSLYIKQFLSSDMKKKDTEAGKKTEITVSENGVTIPEREVSLSASELADADMIGFFIYQGRCYVQYEWIYEVTDLAGEYLGTATGLIDEWTPQEGYVELAGSVGGDFYTVNGYDPSFLLCMKNENAVSTYICNTGLTLKYGSELYEDRLHLSENMESIQYESRDSWYFGKEERYSIAQDNEVMRDVIKELDCAEFLPSASVPLENGQSSISDTERYHLYIGLKNGTNIHLRVHENGYVRFQGFLDLCVQLPEETFRALLELLENEILP